MIKKTEIDYLNYNDLNEIEDAIEETTNYIKTNYVSVIPTFEKKTWSLNELPYVQEIDRIEQGVENLGLYYLKPLGWLSTKEWITDDNLFPIKSFDYRDYNRWINNILVVGNVGTNTFTLWDGNTYIDWDVESLEEWLENENDRIVIGNIIKIIAQYRSIAKYIRLYGITKQETSTRSINYCPDIDKWSLNNGAYIENGYIVLPKNTANAISPLIPIDKQQYFWFAYAKVYTEIENNKVLSNTQYYDGDKKLLSGNGNAVSIGTVSVDNNYYWNFGGGSGTQYGQALYNAKYIRISFAYNSNYSNGAYKIKCPMITSERQPTFVPYVPNMPSPDYPSEIEVGRGKNSLGLTDGTYTHNGITAIVSNGEISLSGTAIANSFVVIPLNANLSLVSGQYTISTNNEIANSNVRFRIESQGTLDTLLNAINKTNTITYNNETLYGNQIVIRVQSGATLSDFKFKPMIEKGSVATSYLPYNTIEVKSTGKNSFDLNKVTYTNSCTLNEDKSITYKAWASIFVNTENVLKMLKPNTTYTMSFDAEVLNKSSNITETQNLFLLYKPGKSLRLSNLNISNMNLGQKYNSISTFTTPSDLTDYRILSYSSYPSPYSTIKLSNIMLVEGDTEQEYEPYKKSSITYNLGDNFLADKDYIENGVLNKHIGKFVVTNGNFYDGGTWKGYYVYIPNKLRIVNNYLVCDRAIFDKLANKTENTVYENVGNVMFVGNADDTLETLQQKFNGAIIYYELATPEQIQLETTGELEIFEGETNITNDLDTNMIIGYEEMEGITWQE